LSVFRAIKWYISTIIAFIRDVDEGTQRTDGAFRSAIQTAGHAEDVDLENVRKELSLQIENFNSLGSGWSVSNIKKLTIHVAQYRPLAGSSYIETPTSLIGKRAVVNVQNFDNECFRWAILSALYPASRHANRVSQYARYINEVNWDGLRFPVTLAQIRYLKGTIVT
jgi:hypothetical protein